MSMLLLGVGKPGSGEGGGDPIIPANFASVNADGWSTTYNSPPTFDPDDNPEQFTVVRAGYNSLGEVTSYNERLVCTKRIRQPYPDQATLTANQVALSDYVYSTDTISGVLNNSSEISPKPICQWAIPGRRVVGNSLYLELVAFHRNARNGEQVACVEFTATDGTNTVTQLVSTSVISPLGYDQQPVIVYAVTLDIEGLNAGQITVNARVFPWIGGPASIANSADGTETGREFGPLVFTKNVSLASTPPLVYVSLSGVDATVDANGLASGIPKVSTNAATAKANPFATVASAIHALKAATNLTGGFTDGCQVRFMAGTHTMNAVNVGTYTSQSGLVITRDPDELYTAVTLTFAAAWTSRHGRLIWRDLQVTRTANTQVAAVESILENITFNGGGFNSPWSTSALQFRYLKCTFNNCSNGPTNAGAAEHRLIRGCVYNTNSTVEGHNVIGCHFPEGIVFGWGARSPDFSLAAFNECYKVQGICFNNSGNNLAVVQNVFEFVSGTSNAMLRLSGDSATANTNHFVIHHNTMVGFFTHGRSNWFYNDTAPPTLRTHKLISSKGNIHVQLNTKHDIFAGVNDGYADANLRVGGWSYLYGVGCESEFTQFADAQGGGLPGDQAPFSQEYAGLYKNFGTSVSVRNDPLFTNYQGTTSVPSAGAGGGTYTVGPSSPCKNMVKTPLLRFDLAGNPRSGSTPTTGAYE